jgi:hypothetical protein
MVCFEGAPDAGPGAGGPPPNTMVCLPGAGAGAPAGERGPPPNTIVCFAGGGAAAPCVGGAEAGAAGTPKAMVCCEPGAPPEFVPAPRPKTIVALAGLCSAGGRLGAASWPFPFAMKTCPHRVHWTGAPCGGISASSSRYVVAHFSQEICTPSLYHNPLQRGPKTHACWRVVRRAGPTPSTAST